MEEKKEEKWLMPEDIKVIETNKPDEMLHKYLAEHAVKTWTENSKLSTKRAKKKALSPLNRLKAAINSPTTTATPKSFNKT